VRALEVRGAFGLENLALVERPDPADPGPGQVVLRMAAASLNYRDLLMVQGKYNPRQALPLIPGSDGVGRVEAVGPGVRRVKVGDRVSPIFAQAWLAGAPTREQARLTLGGPLDGTLAEKMLVDAEGLVQVPESLTDEEAATLPCAAVTAWNALVVEGRIESGQTVLVQGTGGVSLFALQLGRLLGARVIVTSSSDEKLERAKALGASDGINYRTTPEWGKRVKELTGGLGADLVVEVGGAGTLQQSLAAVRFGGTIALIGVLAGNSTDLSLTQVFMQRIRLQGVLVGNRTSFEAMNRAIALHRMRPVIDRVFELEEASGAFEHLANAGPFGKIVVRL
jgi:NADPH:quinone reductase-like Zn-dependent oxidoreductase